MLYSDRQDYKSMRDMSNDVSQKLTNVFQSKEETGVTWSRTTGQKVPILFPSFLISHDMPAAAQGSSSL
jgi:hypothetical protein